jgi:Lsr2
MAERAVRQLIDDLDGTEIADGTGEQIEFAVREVTYRIDLSKGNVVMVKYPGFSAHLVLCDRVCSPICW